MAKKRKRKLTKDGSVALPTAGTDAVVAASLKQAETSQVIRTLQGYAQEAQEARRSGMNPRDDKWSQNLDLYWNRYDFSYKANWQAKEVMPEVPTFVDRFAAALKEALVATPNGFYTVIDPADTENDLAAAVKRMMDVWLTTAGTNPLGQPLPFSAVFEEQMKLGAIMASSGIVTWKNDTQFGRVAVENIDPRFIWLDHTGRNLYRIRRVEMDRHELPGLLASKDNKGLSVFREDELERMVNGLRQEDERWIAERSGSGTQQSSVRKPVVMDEYLATVLDDRGEVIGSKRGLYVLANNEYLVRGPEANPFWHGKDWIVYAPLVTAPLSPYGRSYMEDFGAVAKTFTNLTNMILDAVHTSSLKAFAVVPSMLSNPGQIAEGISPNKMFLLEDGARAEDFIKEIDLGNLSADAFQVWTAMKNELREAANLNEVGIGQFAPKGRTSATEISETQQSSSALIRSVAQTVETRILDIELDLMWKTGMQHVRADDVALKNAVGEDMFGALLSRRKELVKRNYTFQARGISTIIARGTMLKALMNIMGVIAQNDVLLQAFLQKIDVEKFVGKLFELSNIDLHSMQTSEREKMIRAATAPLQAAGGQPGGAAPAGAGGEMEQIAQMIGAGR